MNTNLIHNVLNVLTLVVAAIGAVLVKLGCTTTVTGDFDCSASTIPPQYALYVVGGMMLLKIIINVGRDGWSGLTKIQPPVQK